MAGIYTLKNSIAAILALLSNILMYICSDRINRRAYLLSVLKSYILGIIYGNINYIRDLLMLNQLKLFFEQHIALPAPNQLTEENLRLACAALFIEMMGMDDKEQAEEHDMILSRIKDMFSLSVEQATTLISLAAQERELATDYFQFTSLINKGFTQEKKVRLIKTLWQIAYADGQLDKHEEKMVRKMADLLHVPHLDFIKTKIQVIDD